MELTAETFTDWIKVAYPEYKKTIDFENFLDASINVYNLGIRVRDFLNNIGKNVSEMSLYAFKEPIHISLICTVNSLIMDMGYEVTDSGEVIYEFVAGGAGSTEEEQYKIRDNDYDSFGDKVISFIYKLTSNVN